MVAEIKKKLLDLIDRWSKEQLDFLITLCNQNSYTFNKNGTDRLAALVLERLQDFFPIYRNIEQSETGDHHILKTKDTGKASYLLGHLDTVFPSDHPFQACRQEGKWLIGPGTADMKGGLTVMVYALRALDQTGLLENLNVAVILGADEENGSASSQEIYEKERQIASICLTAECAGENGEVVVSRNGKAGGRLECSGRDRHVGSEGEEKASAVLEIAKKVIAFESLNALFPEVRVNVGQIEGGLGPGTIPGQASFLFDLRWEKEEHHAPLLERLQEIASSSDNPLCESRLTLLNHRPAMPEDEKTHTLFSKLQETAEELGQDLSAEHRRGTSDANYFGAVGVPTLDGFGPIGVKDHTPGERILISSLKDRTALLACFLLDMKEESL